MTLKTLVTGVAAAAVMGAAAAGVSSIASATLSAAPAVQPVVHGAPLPLNPAADVPSPGQLQALLDGLGDPNVPFRSKSHLIEGGVGIIEGRTADRLVESGQEKGYFPMTFTVANITPAGPGAATATVTAAGPSMTPTTQTVTFVNQGGWKLSRDSGVSLLRSALA